MSTKIAKAASKRMEKANSAFEKTKVYSFIDAIKVLQSTPSVKFDESIDVALHVGVDARKHSVRGVSQLPHGTGRAVKVAVFAEGDAAAEAKKAGAEMVGTEDLCDKLKNGPIDGQVVIATPDMMGMGGKLAKILGPKGLMPNPKMGTVTPHVGQAVTGVKKGQASFRLDKAAIIHSTIGKRSFTVEQLHDNCNQLLADVKKLKPAQAKGQYFVKLSVSSTMGPGLPVDIKTAEQVD